MEPQHENCPAGQAVQLLLLKSAGAEGGQSTVSPPHTKLPTPELYEFPGQAL
jgi:hypothetical protein